MSVLRGLLTKAKLEGLSSDPKSIKASVDLAMELPTFGGKEGPPPGLKESRDLAHCHPELVRRYLLLKADFEYKTKRQLFETCTWRSKERQQELYAQGRTKPGKIVTKVDGVTKKSRHQPYPSQAIDTCVDSDPGPGKVAVWDAAAYELLGPLAKKYGLVWGGDWNGNGRSDDELFVDYPHLELPSDVA